MTRSCRYIILDLVRKLGTPHSAIGLLRAGPRRDIVWKQGEVCKPHGIFFAKQLLTSAFLRTFSPFDCFVYCR